MIDISQCPICGSQNLIHFLTCSDHSVSHETFQLKRCTHCQLVITAPRPADDQLSAYYVSPAYTSHIDKAKTWVDRLYLLARNFTLKWKVSLIDQHTAGNGRIKKLLDYGCGTGEFLRAAKKQGWHIHGIEPSANARTHASSLVKGDIAPSLDELAVDGRYDAITLWHVLEHVADLDMTIQKLTTLLSNHGTLFIAVPNHQSWDGKKYKSDWAGYDVPRHLWHFTKENIKMLLEKNNLKLVTHVPMRLDAFYICMLSEKYKANNVLTFSTILKAFLNGVRSNLNAKKNGAYSSLIFIATK